MGMRIGSLNSEEPEAMADINTTPLVDVMLVLLIIFLIAVPVVVQTAPVNIPKVTNVPLTTKPENIVVSVDRAGMVFWGTQRLAGGRPELHEKVKAAVIAAVQETGQLPEVHFRGDKDAPYEMIGGAIYAVQTAGIMKIGFISEPEAGFSGRR